ncbi:hypothetical protein WME76_43705 [Sorangium sp. So ce119]|uniref:hypothetical protein n=1 Tax=Sorangium sp. So ce119 TaxID=3133279 RepID=UPI003F62DA89
MTSVRKGGAALAGAFGFALLASAMLTSDPATAIPKGCTMAGGTQLGNVDVTPEDPQVCVRKQVSGALVAGLDSCHSVAKDILKCTTVYTPAGSPSACTLSGGTQLGNVYVSSETPSVCVRMAVPGAVLPGLSSCHSVAKDILKCTTVYTGPT